MTTGNAAARAGAEIKKSLPSFFCTFWVCCSLFIIQKKIKVGSVHFRSVEKAQTPHSGPFSRTHIDSWVRLIEPASGLVQSALKKSKQKTKMINVTEKQIQTAPFKTLPEFELIQKYYPKENWMIMGTLTHARPTSAETQLRHFRELVHAIGKPNNTFGHRLHWVCRVGGGAGTSSHTHLHFLLAKHCIVNGHRFTYNPNQLIDFIHDNWNQFGMKAHQRVQLFDSSRPGVEYVLKDESPDQERMVEMSQGLRQVIKKEQKVIQSEQKEFDDMLDAVKAGMRNNGMKEVIIDGLAVWKKQDAT